MLNHHTIIIIITVSRRRSSNSSSNNNNDIGVLILTTTICVITIKIVIIAVITITMLSWCLLLYLYYIEYNNDYCSPQRRAQTRNDTLKSETGPRCEKPRRFGRFLAQEVLSVPEYGGTLFKVQGFNWL